MAEKLKLSKTLAEVARCFEAAEKTLRSDVGGVVGYLSESEITLQFRILLSKELDASSSRGQIGDAFASDLKSYLDRTGLSIAFLDDPQSLARGLVATASFHPMQTEGKVTGGDFGLVIAQPEVRVTSEGIQIESQKDQVGLLTQAKSKQPRTGWGGLTKPQRRILPGREDYLALLGYEYSDERKLLPFSWWLCRGHTLSEVEGWLLNDSFPEARKSSEIIKSLGAGVIGTRDRNVIDRVVRPDAGSHLTILIDWKGGKPPRSRVGTWFRHEIETQQSVHVRQTY